MSAKFTPGPWAVAHLDHLKRTLFGIAGPAGSPNVRFLAKIPKREDGYFETDYANARLIAAAPQLLEALRFIANVTDSGLTANDCQIHDRARAAIAKATGDA